MKIQQINIKGMHNVKDKTYNMSNFNYLYGKNGAGKTTVMQAVQLALLGYIPGTDKNKTAIFRHSGGQLMVITLKTDSGITIVRSWRRKGKEIVTDVSITPAGTNIESILGGLELPVLNFNEFVGMTANKLKDWFINFLPSAKDVIDWKSELMNPLNGFGRILDTGFTTAALKYVNGLELKGLDQIRCFHEWLKEQQSAMKAEQSRVQSTIQSLIYYDDCDDMFSLDELTAKRTELITKRDLLNNKFKDLMTNKKIQIELDKIKSLVTADSILNDTDYQKCAEELQLLVAQHNELKAQRDANVIHMAKINLIIADKKKVVDGAGKCPYTCTQCDNISKLLKLFQLDLNKAEEELKEVTAEIISVNNSLDDFSIKISELQRKEESIKTAYARKEMLALQINEDVLEDDEMSLTEQLNKVDAEIKANQDLIVKLEANKRYNELTEKLTADKFRIEQNIEILKTWIKLTDVNGLQSTIMNEPFINLESKISQYIGKFFNDNCLTAKFVLTEKMNSFDFGMTDAAGYYRSFDLLSSGEKCLYTLALMLSIVESSDTELPFIMIDDLLDHLDEGNFNSLFTALYEVSTVQVLLAGVQACNHENASDFVIEVK